MNAPLHTNGNVGNPNAHSTVFRLGMDYKGSPFGNPDDIVELDQRTRTLHNRTQGTKIKLAVLPDQVMDAEANRSYLSGYRLPGMCADDISPIVPTSVHKDKYTTTSTASAYQIPDVNTSVDGPVHTIDVSWSQDEYQTKWYGLGTYVPNPTQEAVRDVRNPTQLGLKRIAQKLMLAREKRVLDTVTTSGNWTAANVVTLASGYHWNGGANSAPITDLKNRILASRQQCTAIFMGQEAGFAFIEHDDVSAHVKKFGAGDNSGINISGNLSRAQTEKVMLSVPMLPPIVIVASEYETANGVRTRMLPSQVVLTASEAGVPTDAETINTIKTFRYKGQGQGYITRAYVVNDRGVEGGMMHLVYQAECDVMTGTDVGGLIIDAIQ